MAPLATLMALVALVCPPAAAVPPPTSTDARAIMKAVRARDDGDKLVAKMRMVIKDSSGAKRVREVQLRGLDFKGGTRQLILFSSPADVRNTGLLTVDYDEASKVDDQWLYLPSLRKSTRISSSKKSGAFMGSDISFSDMTRQSPANYDYKIVKQRSRAGGDDCWVIEARPRTKKAKEETGYLKSLIWVSKSKMMAIQAKHWIIRGRKIKLMKFARIKKINGIWFAHRILARTLQARQVLSTTYMTFSGVRLGDTSVKAADFTQRRLERGL